MESSANSISPPSLEIVIDYMAYNSSSASSESAIETSQVSLSASSTLGDSPTDSTRTSGTDEDPHVLYNMNHNLKSSLTELLNSKAVREDDTMRAWAQTRLMEAERELRRQRRRRAVPTISVESEV